MKKKKLRKPDLHQHIDKQGVPFGSWHPEDAEHKNHKTQTHHLRSIKLKETI